jgi:hypothetical protein
MRLSAAEMGRRTVDMHAAAGSPIISDQTGSVILVRENKMNKHEDMRIVF